MTCNYRLILSFLIQDGTAAKYSGYEAFILIDNVCRRQYHVNNHNNIIHLCNRESLNHYPHPRSYYFYLYSANTWRLLIHFHHPVLWSCNIRFLLFQCHTYAHSSRCRDQVTQRDGPINPRPEVLLMVRLLIISRDMVTPRTTDTPLGVNEHDV